MRKKITVQFFSDGTDSIDTFDCITYRISEDKFLILGTIKNETIGINLDGVAMFKIENWNGSGNGADQEIRKFYHSGSSDTEDVI